MKIIVISLVLLGSCLAPATAEDLILGFRSKSSYQLVVPDADPEADAIAADSAAQAASFLKSAFAAQGIQLDIKPESEADPDKHGIYVGRTRFAASNGVDATALAGWQYRHKVVGPNVIIVGNDEADTLTKHRGGREIDMPYWGTRFGATEFAYRYLGARYLRPGPDEVTYIPLTLLTMPRDLDRQAEPYFLEHDFMNSVPASKDTLFQVANHGRRFQSVWSHGGHTHSLAVPMSKYGKTHPEYFAKLGGVRQPSLSRISKEHLCFSNPEVRELIYRQALAKFDAGFEVVELGPSDGYIPCGCDPCAELYGIDPATFQTDGLNHRNPVWGEKLWIMHRDFAERLMKDRPGKKVMLTSYGPTGHPPQTFKEFPPNAIIEMMYSSPESFASWEDISVPGGFSVYLYNWSSSLEPLQTISQIEAQSRLLVEHNVRIVQLNGKPRLWGIEGPNIYAYLRLGIDPHSKSADELFNEYLQAAYREAEIPMRRFFTTLQKRVGLKRVLVDYVRQIGGGNQAHLYWGAIYSPDVINALEKDLSQAETTANLPEVKHRLEIVRYEFDNIKHIAVALNAYRNFQAQHDEASLNQLLDALEARDRFIDSVVNGDGKYPKGKNPALRYSKPDHMKFAKGCPDVVPLNWDVARVRANPGTVLKVEEETMTATSVDVAPTLDAAVWDEVPAQALVPVKGGDPAEAQATTTFKVLRDQEHLYVRVSGDQPASKMTFENRGRDAELWLQESIVINVSPIGDRSRYYYFAYEPQPDSFNDAAHGFITDVLHPLYGWNDESWNGDWSFQSRLDPKAQRWESMAIIPFATMGASAPKKGELWFLNVGRVHFFDDPERSKVGRELSAWTGTINASRIPGDASFGTLNFE